MLTRPGHINRHRTQLPSEKYDQMPESSSSRPRGNFTSGAPDSAASWRSSRVSPYARGRGRVGKPDAKSHRHRTLVLNNQSGAGTQATSTSAQDLLQPPGNTLEVEPINGGESSNARTGWVTKHDRHMQLINSSIYDKETQTRSKAIEETRRQKAALRDQREKEKIERHLKTLASHASHESAAPMNHEITINGSNYLVVDGGSKLIRVRGEHRIIRGLQSVKFTSSRVHRPWKEHA